MNTQSTILSAGGVSSACRSISGSVVRWLADRIEKEKAPWRALAERRAAEEWAEALPKRYLADLESKVAMPAHLWRPDRIMSLEDYNEAEALYAAYVAENFREETEVRRKALTAEVYGTRWSVWMNEPLVKAYFASNLQNAMAENAARDAQKAAAWEAQRNYVNPNSAEGRRRWAEQTYASTGVYADRSGRILTPAERFQLGLTNTR